MFLLQGLTAKFGRDFRRFRARFRLADQRFERLPFLFGVVIRESHWRVIFRKVFEDAAVAASDHVAGGKMQQRGVMGIAHEIEHVRGGADVRRERVAKIGIEIREPGAVDDHVERSRARRRRTSGCRPRPGLRDVAFDHFDAFAQEFGEDARRGVRRAVRTRAILRRRAGSARARWSSRLRRTSR